MRATARAFSQRCSYSPLSTSSSNRKMNLQDKIVNGSSPIISPSPLKAEISEKGGELISLREWQGWGTTSPVPGMVVDIIEDMKALEKEVDTQMSFGIKGKLEDFIVYLEMRFQVHNTPILELKGKFKVQEDRKHRAKYQALKDSEEKLQYFSARQIACRLLGSRGYLCQKCWLALEDCMCSRLVSCSLWHGIRFWIYMHPKDFLRQNNTGKLLWQIFGVEAASLCLFGIHEHEEIMWDALKHAGMVLLQEAEVSPEMKKLTLSFGKNISSKNMAWCLYPNKNASTKSVQDICFREALTKLEEQSSMGRNFHIGSATQMHGHKPLNFILIDGTWNNSASMFSRLKERAKMLWGEDDIPCISLSMPGVSTMHKLRPQPSWDRTCTAAAVVGLLSELHFLPEFSLYGLDKQAEAVEDALTVLLDALTNRRLRMGRSIKRTQKIMI